MKYSFVRLGLSFLALISPHAWSASFDCARARTLVEHTICADQQLGQLDEQQASKYRQLLSSHSDPALIRARQQAWLKERNKCAGDDLKACLQRHYKVRIEELGGSASAPPTSQGRSSQEPQGTLEAVPQTEDELKARQRATRIGG